MRRFWEVLPAILSWGTLAILVILSWRTPMFVALFIVLYDLYWLLKSLYLLVYLHVAFRRMKKNIETDWPRKLEASGSHWRDIYHLIILPSYREPYEVVKASMESFFANRYPRERLIVVLATEERGGEPDREVAARLTEEFGNLPLRFFVTTHPRDIPGELPGKGSNETWATKRVIEEVINPLNIPHENVLVSVFDSDTRPGPDYFSVLTHAFLTAERPHRSSYQPIPLYMNNIRKVSVFARLNAFSSSFWQFMQQGRPEQLVTFSSHSMPLQELIEVGFWNTDIVSEDSRIFFQCLNRYDGDWRTVPLFYPVSLDAVSGSTTFESLVSLYKQQRRWAWGIENIPFLGMEFGSNPRVTFRKKAFWMLVGLEGFWSWATSSFVIFLFGFLPNTLGGDAFRETIVSYNLPQITGTIINVSMVGIVASAIASVLLLAPELRRERFAWYYYAWYAVQWALIPFTFIIFSAIPALDAQTRMVLGGKFRLGFWRTPKRQAE